MHSLGPAPLSDSFATSHEDEGSHGLDPRLSRAASVASSSFTLADRDEAGSDASETFSAPIAATGSADGTRSGAGSWFEISEDEADDESALAKSTDSLRRRASRSATLR